MPVSTGLVSTVRTGACGAVRVGGRYLRGQLGMGQMLTEMVGDGHK